MFEDKNYGEIPRLRFVTNATINDAGFFPLASLTEPVIALPGGQAGIISGFRHIYNTNEVEVSNLISINIYRAPVNTSITTVASYELAFKLPVRKDGIASPPNIATPRILEIQIVDAGVGDPSITPEIDFSIFTAAQQYLIGASCSAYYQERHITAFSDFINEQLGPGDIAVTTLGKAMGFQRPTILRAAGAFGFRVPTDDGSPVRKLVAGERLVAMTDNGTYVIQGGEQGILTPFEINPVKISSEGSSKFVEPLVIGNNIIYVNSSHKKLLRVVFGDNFRAGVQELSRFSDDFLDGREIIEMEKFPTRDDVAILLRGDGTLFAVTISEEGVAGFADIDLGDIKIETMYITGVTTDPVLVFVGIVNGIRAQFTVNDEEDLNAFRSLVNTNMAIEYGTRFLELTDQGYLKISPFSDTISDPATRTKIETLNISSATDYNAGTTLTITSDILLDAPASQFDIFESYNMQYDRIAYFYDDADGVEQFFYINIDPATRSGSGPFVYEAVASDDIPGYLQNVQGQSLTNNEKAQLQSRWLYATRRLRAKEESSNVGIWALYLLLKEGATATPVTPPGAVDVAVRADGVVYSSPLNPNLTPNLAINSVVNPPVSPTDVSELLFWLDAEVGPVTTGSRVTEWSDRSGNNFGVASDQLPTTSTAPILVSSDPNLGGKPYIAFTPGEAAFEVPVGLSQAIVGANGLTTIVVVKKSTDTGGAGIFGFQAHGNNHFMRGSIASDQQFTSFSKPINDESGANWGQTTPSGPIPQDTWLIYEINVNLLTNNQDSYTNNSDADWNNPTVDFVTETFSTDNFGNQSRNRVGATQNGSTGEVDIAELITYRKSITQAERDVIIEYFNTKYGFDIPYVIAPPSQAENIFIDLPDFVTYIEAGVPFESTMETLRIERGDGTTLSDDRKIINKVGLAVYNTQNGFVGPATAADLMEMSPLVTRECTCDLSSPDGLYTGHIPIFIPGEWTEDGKVKVTQVDPSPMTILSIYPKGLVGD
jgi:hypothetical protein